MASFARTAVSFQDLVNAMYASALPVSSQSGRIVEFPQPMEGAITGYSIQEFLALDPEKRPSSFIAKPDGSFSLIDEYLDVGHRHFSGMHWLFPNNFHVQDKALLDIQMAAGRETMTAKRNNNGGHTSWSSAWEACLWARLRNGDETMRSLRRILGEFSAPNMLSLHPALMRSSDPRCDTCFTSTSVGSSGASIEPDAARGMTSIDGSKVSPSLRFAIHKVMISNSVVILVSTRWQLGVCRRIERGFIADTYSWSNSVIASPAYTISWWRRLPRIAESWRH